MKCKIKCWSMYQTDLQTVSNEIEDFLSTGEVRQFETFFFRDQLVLIVIFENE